MPPSGLRRLKRRAVAPATLRGAGRGGGWLNALDGVGIDYERLYQWSVDHPERFWPEVWRYCGVIADERPGRDPWDDVVVGLDRMAPPDPVLGPRWFTGARLNFAENLLRFDDDQEALVSWNESGQACGADVRGIAGGRARCRRRASRAGHRGRGSRRRLHAEHSRGGHRDAGDGEPWRDLVVVLARLRREGRAGPVRPDRAARAVHRRRVSLCGEGDRFARPRA